MAFTYTVHPGDTLSAIARRHDLPSWQAIYFHPANAPFRARRPNPDLIRLGGVLILPLADPGRESCLRECERRCHENHLLPHRERWAARLRCERDCRGRPV
jgi:hypothetical protein